MNITELMLSHLSETTAAHAIGALQDLAVNSRTLPNGATVMGDAAGMGLVTGGMVAKLDRTSGRDVITSVYTTGQLFNAEIVFGARQPLIAKGRTSVEHIDGASFTSLLEICPQLEQLAWKATVGDAYILTHRLKAANALRASGCLAHFLCEMAWRSAQELRPRMSLPMPLLQRDIAAMLGYTAIHMNRAARELRDRGLIDWRKDRLDIHDGGSLARLGAFDPGYLQVALFSPHGAVTAMAAE